MGRQQQPEPATGETQPEIPPGFLARHGAAMARHARAVTFVAILLAVAGYLVAALGVGGPSLFSRLEVGEPTVSGEALTGREMLTAADPSGEAIQAFWRDVDPQSQEVAEALTSAHRDLVSSPGVLAVTDPTTVGPAAVAADGSGVLIVVTLESGLDGDSLKIPTERALQRLLGLADEIPGSSVDLTGSQELEEAITGQVKSDLTKGEAISLPLSLLVMVLIFGGFAAAGVPMAGAVAAIAGGLVSLLLFSYVIDLDATVVNVVTVLGLGLCIDYSLLIVSRYREQMHELFDLTGPGAHERVPYVVREVAMARTMATAGRTVVFSGVTVAISVAGLMLIQMPMIRSVGAAAVSVVMIAVLVALTLVPALLVLATKQVAGAGLLARAPGFRKFAGKFDSSPSDDGFFSDWARQVQRRPWAYFLTVSAALIVLSIPAWRMNFVSSGVELLPPDNIQRQIYTTIETQFPDLASPQINVVVAAPDTPGGTASDTASDTAADTASGTAADTAAETAALTALGAEIAKMPGVTRVEEVRTVGDVIVLPIHTTTEAAKHVVSQIRADRPVAPATYVTGQAAQLVDFQDRLRRDVPLALITIMLATLSLLFLLTGSVLVPAKALLMNMLSLGATFGLLVLIFQDGRFEGPLGYQSAGGIEATLPVIIFAFAFGLSMDYEVFLLARIKEFRDAGMDNNESVRMGMQRTGRIITSAATLIIIVFAGFIFGDMLAIKQTGIALAVAVFIDATLVRLILVPATMTLLGEWNWWAPPVLRRLHNRFGVSH